MRLLTRSAPIVCALLLRTVPALAQSQHGHTERPLLETLQGPAKDAYVSAEILFKNGDYAGSVIKYQRAYDLSKDPRLLFDMALAEKSLRAYAKMQGLLEQYEREGGSHISADDKGAVDSALAAIRNLVGTVTVSANVEGAAVSIDEQAVGTTPLAAPLVLDLGKHTVTAQKSGFETVRKTFEITGGGAVPVILSLSSTTHTGQLVVAAEPGSTIVIDGQTTASGRFDAPLVVGPHEVSVTAPGKEAYKTSVDLREHETRTLEVTLSDESHGAIWPWVVGGAVVAAGAVVGGYFAFRTHDETTPVPSAPLFNLQLMSFRPR